jgi:hypothetical protein
VAWVQGPQAHSGNLPSRKGRGRTPDARAALCPGRTGHGEGDRDEERGADGTAHPDRPRGQENTSGLRATYSSESSFDRSIGKSAVSGRASRSNAQSR